MLSCLSSSWRRRCAAVLTCLTITPLLAGAPAFAQPFLQAASWNNGALVPLVGSKTAWVHVAHGAL